MRIKAIVRPILLLLSLFYLGHLNGQSDKRLSGPIIKGFGEVFPVVNPDHQLDTQKVYKVVFDVMKSPEDSTVLNSSINTIARFLNMHAMAGLPKENMQVACVFHNSATKDALSNDAYQKKHGVPNPNSQLIEALQKAGVETYICGQSINARGVDRSELADSIRVALSAMTILIDYQSNGYQLIKF